MSQQRGSPVYGQAAHKIGAVEGRSADSDEAQPGIELRSLFGFLQPILLDLSPDIGCDAQASC